MFLAILQYALIDSQDFEVGREAPADLQDVSSNMPWNPIGSVRGSHRGSSVTGSRGFPSAGFSASGPGRFFDPHLPSRRVSRMTSASPMVGRGGTSGFERLSSVEIAGAEVEAALLGGQTSEDQEALQEFELHGPPADIEGAVAVETEQNRESLDQESVNFLQYLRSGLEAGQPAAATESGTDVPVETASRDFVVFEELLQPSETSHMVAAQAFYHTLALATRNLITVEQTVPFGEIRMTPIATG